MQDSRIPRLALAAWALAVAALAGLGVAVAYFLSSGGHHGMTGMAGSTTADAFARGGAGVPSRPMHEVLLTAWHLDATAVAVLVLMAAVYLTGVALVPRRSPDARWPAAHTASFLAGLAVAAFATNGSIAVYDQVLFTAHMAGHLALVMIAPALLMWGRPLQLLLAALPPRRRERAARLLRGPVVSVLSAPPVVLASYTVVIVGSHLTGLMGLVMRNTWAGQVEHLVYLVAGCQFFLLVVGDEPIRWRLGSPARWLLLALAMAVDTFTGVILMQQTTPVSVLPSALNGNTLADTRAGGAIMWFGGDAIMAVIMIGLVIGWLRTVDLAQPDRGWLEQARTAAFTNHTGAEEPDETSIDTDDDAREAYNRWLARINE